ncbi:tRNA preQ1(34) S-adenosylmethionine ribosyltransferase-isomerase QueA [candidate division KSB1 bacterium]|nr:MAG: tRNA preQ1(34) S-adenosylmethionine ribosyltransferase-isomerase QueA [candidate division KSB1 bacterium]
MKLSDFKYKINEKLIAQFPLKERDKSRLMVVNREEKNISMGTFWDILNYLNEGDCLVVNETKVFSARLKGIKEKTDAEVEIFLLRELENNLWEVLVKPARKVRIGNKLIVNEGVTCDVIDNTVSGGRVVRFNYDGDFYELIERIGKSPLPPYIKREPVPEDRQWYQTIFARVRGAVAAPTAGLHFTHRLIDEIERKGVKVVPILLHVGLGTFRPVVVEDLTRHRMDSEYYEVSEESANIINSAKEKGNKVMAVGTTVVRALESTVTSDGHLKPSKGWTDKFIYPPYEFKTIDMLITNFHQPCSTLLMLVSAFASRDLIFKAYRKAIKEKFRFYSYGDAMLII